MKAERNDETREASGAGRAYAAPRILWTEQLTGRATACNAADDSCAPGPIQT